MNPGRYRFVVAFLVLLAGVINYMDRAALGVVAPLVMRETRSSQEQKIKEIAAMTSAELVILARYMQILSDDLASHFSGRCINIDHPFLPSFKGAKPYCRCLQRVLNNSGAAESGIRSPVWRGS